MPGYTCDENKQFQTCSEGFFYLSSTFECLRFCPDGYFIQEESNTCEKCSPNCKTCEKNPNLCKTCSNDTFYDESINSCISKCKDGTYIETIVNACLKCDKTCLTCIGKEKWECLSCDINSELKLINGYCTKKCSEKLIEIQNSGDCIDFNDCFESLTFNYPKIFSIASINFKANLEYKLNENCLQYKDDISISWGPIPDVIISDDKLRIEVPVYKLIDGNMMINVDLKYNNQTFKSLSGNSVMITNKVIIYLKFLKNKKL